MATYSSLEIEEVLREKSPEISGKLDAYKHIFTKHKYDGGCKREESKECFICCSFEYLEIINIQKSVKTFFRKKKINVDIMRVINIFLFRLKYIIFQSIDKETNDDPIIRKVKKILYEIQSFFEIPPLPPPRENIPKS